MKIAIPVDNNKLESTISNSFGRAAYFLIYETENKNVLFLDNSAIASQGGAGIKAAQTIVDSGAKVLIAPQCGENAAKVIQAANIKIYKNENKTITDTINAFTEGKLPLLDDIHPGYHNHGG